jgi:hypothetical protein
MKFKELETYKTTFDDFPLKWRFDSKSVNELADFDNNLAIINKKGCKKIAGFIGNWKLHSDFPFMKDLFLKNDHFSIAESSDAQIKTKLDSLGFDDTKKILLMWDNETTVLTNWRFLKNHLSDFFYPSSDDLTVFDESMQWSILIHHSETVYHSTNNLTQAEYSDLLTDYFISNFKHFEYLKKVYEDLTVDFEITSPSCKLTLWISSRSKEISVGFEDTNGKSDWHTHMSLFGANSPKEQLQVMSDLINQIIDGKERIAFNTDEGYFLTNNLEAENELTTLRNWNEL